MVLASSAWGQEDWRSWPTGDRFSFEVSGYYVTADSDLNLIINNEDTINWDLEDALGLNDSETVLTVRAMWRFARHHSIRFSHFAWDQQSTAVFLDDNDELVEASTRLDVQNDYFSYNYSFIFNERSDFYGGIGLSWTQLFLGFDDGGQTIPDGEDIDASVPVPSFTLGYDLAFSEKWVWRNQLNYLALGLALNDEEDLGGTVVGLNTAIEWRVFDNFSLTAAYQYDYLDVDAGDSVLRVNYQDTYYGPRLGLILRF
jgi:hypothetical protein